MKIGVDIPESKANFIFAKIRNPKKVYEEIKRKKILVRYFDAEMMNDGLRITIGTKKQIDLLVRELEMILFKI